jgi:metal transporter CNNM
MSGMTVGLASIDKLDVEIKKQIGSEAEKKSARAIESVIKNHHWMLCALLIGNASCMEALPIFLDKLFPEAIAIIISVTCVLFFGEIIPMSLCTGPNQFRIAELCCPMVKLFMYLTFPISRPLGCLLDCILGGEHAPRRFKTDELNWAIKEHV